jgi:hypothetical protein
VRSMATIVDTTALWRTVVTAFVAGVGVTFAFSIAILGTARFIDLGRDGRTGAATAFAALAALALIVCAGAIVLGVVVMTQK